MGAKTWMLVCSDGDARERLHAARAADLDRGASTALGKRLFPSETLTPIADGSLSFTNPPDDELLVGCFPGVAVLAAGEFALDRPSQLPARFLAAAPGRVVQLHAMHSVVDWLAFAVWKDGALQRSLSLSPDSGIIEDIGERLPFEAPYWAGEHPAGEPGDGYPLPFHPLELGEEALAEFFGYMLEGPVDDTLFDPERVPLMAFKRRKPWLRRWLGRG